MENSLTNDKLIAIYLYSINDNTKVSVFTREKDQISLEYVLYCTLAQKLFGQ